MNSWTACERKLSRRHRRFMLVPIRTTAHSSRAFRLLGYALRVVKDGSHDLFSDYKSVLHQIEAWFDN